MKGVILDSQTLKPSELDFSALENELPHWTYYEQTGPDDVKNRLRDVTVAITNKVVIDEEALAAAPELKLIGISATGTNNVDLDAARRRGVVVCNVSGYGTETVAQHTLALALGLATRWHQYDRDVRQAWPRSSMFCRMDYPVFDLNGKTLGLIGHGALGRRVEALAKAFGMRVRVARSLRPDAAPDPARAPLEQLLAESDLISLHCPLTEHTDKLVNRDFLAAMKPGAGLINTARGGLVDEPALAEALRAGRLGGAALDVLGQEPPPADHPLLAADLPNLIITPHSAWVSTESRQRLLDGVVANVRAWKAGRPINVVNGLSAA
ncbi:MAG: glycerate dehydrogenase [Alcanivorax sp.]|nr:glycerate dehydrogenase [Alcanivorax sp.]MBI55444.1 glycerate dehydrogenase [Alcanivorax sp.]MBM1142656.1 D-2-hydroxyacid dehydrogenase [Alcanivorax sp. ZXX171]MBU59461.1 glycerate dehydrogenase [Alcanivorax sp.]HCE38898.1 glycerate dehydrogenase [Alcanivorax sp.]|tara:strand:- start:34628 stop:35599 length:972 start_codon:yes stop_codon:yes gene_type:complete